MTTPAHMTADEFRKAGHELIDWIASYWERLQKRDPSMPVLCQSKPGDVEASLPELPPERGESWKAIFSDFERIVMPGITHWQSPGFFGFFPADASGPAVLGDLLSSGVGVQGMLWATSPAATELETRMLDWMGSAIGLPARFTSASATGGGVIQGTASEATLVGMLAARHRVTGAGKPGAFVAYTSTQAHSSVIKGAMVAGLADGPDDRRNMRLIEVDDAFAMNPGALEKAIRDDLAAGRTPGYVCATVGTTSSTAVDPVHVIGEVCRRHGVWLHVDAAFAGAACVCPEYRSLMDGVELADSFCFNPHKWLLTNFDCSLMWTSDRRSLTSALSITPEYLRNAASQAGAVIDYRDWQIPLGRRFRSLKLWFVMRHYGVEGLRSHIREHMRLAELFEGWVRQDGRFEVVTPRTLSLVCFRLRTEGSTSGPDADARNKRLLEACNATGSMFMSHTVLPGVGYVLRMAIGSTFTREEDVRAAWATVERCTDAIS